METEGKCLGRSGPRSQRKRVKPVTRKPLRPGVRSGGCRLEKLLSPRVRHNSGELWLVRVLKLTPEERRF
ncbi:hypothetical protein NDU88_001490 [Pleurodeles waltl]|uniref:Uncharacterized protein n=1 Tax=Pleurodeles waltl TaxID=8319 RepID=A0AAV7U6L7_PLEWA|nr:hypothetical protein NDU88_001490 [Pleurodeles waltl]